MADEMKLAPKKRGRPRMTEEEKTIAAAKRKSGELPTQKRNRPDLAKFGQENVEPGDNSRYLRHALATLNMPPIDISDPNQVEERIDWYFHHCIENEMKPTVKGFCNSLGIAKSTLWDWRQGNFRKGTHQDIIVKAYNVLEELWEDYMQNGKINPVAGIFLGKNNFGYTDSQEFVVTPNSGEIEKRDVVALEAKYAELPEE